MAARLGRLTTRRGTIETPVFMPVATQAVLRGLDCHTAAALGYKVLLANTYHLLLRPGTDIFRRFGGIHHFMNWEHAILTDSGGFQIFSLARHLQISEHGANFRSYVDGQAIELTPESSIATQLAINSEIMMVLDQCISSTSDEAACRAAMELTARWAQRSYEARGDAPNALFGIVQGGCNEALRRESAQQICSLPFDGFAIGGVAVGEPRDIRDSIVRYTAPLLPISAPRYLMGVGTPIDLLESVAAGMDMFDCILPTSLAVQGTCFTSGGKVALRRSVYRSSEEPLDAMCECTTCRRYSRAYLSHLVRAREYTVHQLLAIHNLTFYHSLMREMRAQIAAGTFDRYYLTQREALVRADDEFPPVPLPARIDREVRRGDYRIAKHTSGYGSIVQISSGETMHSVTEPQIESRHLYVEQCALVEKSVLPGVPLIVWDVGLGAATNAMVGITRLEETRRQSGSPSRFVHIVSFERDLDALRLAIEYPSLFAHLRHRAPHKLLASGLWEDTGLGLRWSLIEGDFLTRLESAPEPDIIWYDPFSYKVDKRLWTYETFRSLFDRCSTKATSLYTYTASTSVRAAMLAAGWYVGKGRGSGPKLDTTKAFNSGGLAAEADAALLDTTWLARWERSGAKNPFGSTDPALLERVRNHPQFRCAPQ